MYYAVPLSEQHMLDRIQDMETEFDRNKRGHRKVKERVCNNSQ